MNESKCYLNKNSIFPLIHKNFFYKGYYQAEAFVTQDICVTVRGISVSFVLCFSIICSYFGIIRVYMLLKKM